MKITMERQVLEPPNGSTTRMLPFRLRRREAKEKELSRFSLRDQ
jgi:hypothetical protein